MPQHDIIRETRNGFLYNRYFKYMVRKERSGFRTMMDYERFRRTDISAIRNTRNSTPCIRVLTMTNWLAPPVKAMTLMAPVRKLKMRNVRMIIWMAYLSRTLIAQSDSTANAREHDPRRFQTKPAPVIPVSPFKMLVPKNSNPAPTPLKTALMMNRALTGLFIVTSPFAGPALILVSLRNSPLRNFLVIWLLENYLLFYGCLHTEGRQTVTKPKRITSPLKPYGWWSIQWM